MGTSGLLKAVKPFMKFVSFSHWRGMRVGMDASMIIHQLLGRFALEIMRDDWTGFADAVKKKRLKIITRHGCLLLLVFDGHRMPGKLANADRAMRRERSMKELNEQSEMVCALQEVLTRSPSTIPCLPNTPIGSRKRFSRAQKVQLISRSAARRCTRPRPLQPLSPSLSGSYHSITFDQ